MPCKVPDLILASIVLLVTVIVVPLPAETQEATQKTASGEPARLSVEDSQLPIPEDVGDSMLIQRRYHEALDAYGKVTDRSPDLWNKMGIAYEMMFDLKDAARCYKKSLGLKSDSAKAMNNLGTVYEMQGDYNKAADLYRKALKLSPDSARISINLGTNLIVRGKYSDGSHMYARALALDPDVFEDPDTLVSKGIAPLSQRRALNYYKALACAQAGLSERAIQFLQKAVNEGFTGLKKAAQSSSFVRLHGNPKFEQLIDQEEKPAH